MCTKLRYVVDLAIHSEVLSNLNLSTFLYQEIFPSLKNIFNTLELEETAGSTSANEEVANDKAANYVTLLGSDYRGRLLHLSFEEIEHQVMDQLKHIRNLIEHIDIAATNNF